jgi:pyruvate,water dikinase
MGRFVYPLTDKRAGRRRHSGGKAAVLARLRSLGFNVPDGFVISTEGCTRFIRSAAPELRVSRTASPDERARIRNGIARCDPPTDIAAEMLDAYRALGGAVAVRSSMAAEDGETSSFAGQLDSVLGVETEESLLDAVKRCVASAFNERVGGYLRSREAAASPPAPGHACPAVLVQRMIRPRYAGVAFGADPISGRRCVIIEGAPGAGVAGGTVSPDRYFVDARGGITVERMSTAPEAAPGTERLLDLARLVRSISAHLNGPQDVEWAWDGITFHILQARPITSLVGREVFSSRLVSEMIPGTIKPLLWSTNVIDMTDNVFGRIFNALLGNRGIDYSHIVKLIHSRVYVNVTFVSRLLKQIGLPANFFEMVVLDELGEKPRPRLSPRLVVTAARMLAFVCRYGFYSRALESFAALHRNRLDQYRAADWRNAQPDTLLGAIDGLRRGHGETQWFMWISAMNMTVRNKLLKSYLTRRLPGIDPSDLLAGRRGLKSLEPDRDMRIISTRLRAFDHTLQELLARGDDAEIRAHLEETDQGRRIIGEFDRFMARYGFLSTHGTDFSVGPWKENPRLIWTALGRLMSAAPRADREDSRLLREETRRRVASRLNFVQRIIFGRLLGSTLHYVRFRERMSFLMSEDVYEMRRLFRALGDRFAERGALSSSDDIFFCRYEELPAIHAGRLDASAIRSRIAQRRADYAADAEIELEDITCDDTASGRTGSSATTPYLSGIIGCAGFVSGSAVVVSDPTEVSGSLTKRDILIVPFTDVGWTPLFPSIGGLVAETGGQLSHSAIIAREYGIPAVVSVKHATRLIRTGQQIAVDGNTGRVYTDHEQQP